MTVTDRPSLLLPPREFVLDGGQGAAVDVAPVIVRDPSLPAQGYRLRIIDDAVRIAAADDAGERYALQTLDQLREQAGRLPAVHIEDSPDFPVRGLMLDISRDRVPTRGTLQRYVALMDLARLNQLELYTEHTFAFTGEQEVWGDASPMTADDIRWLDDLCATHGIELVANQNTFGHLDRFLVVDRHRSRAEAPEGWRLGTEHVPAAVLAPTEENAAFALHLVDELLPLFRSRTVNIGCDETFELGQGVSRDLVERVGRGRVYFDHVLRIMRPLLARGYTVQLWADIVAHHPELLSEVPAGAVPLVWLYEGPTSLRAAAAGDIDEVVVDMSIAEQVEGFEARGRALIAAGAPFWVAPGTSTWRSIVGRTDNARENLLDAAATGLRHGCGGMITTVWGDHGMIEPPTVTYWPILFAGVAGWNSAAADDADVAGALTRRVFRDDGTVAAVLESIGTLWNTLGVPSVNSSPLFDVLMPQLHRLVDLRTADQDAVRRALRVLADADARLAAVTPGSDDGAVVVRELRHAVALAVFAANELTDDPGDPRERLVCLDELLEEQRACWLLRARPGGLEHSIANFAPLRERLRAGGSPR